MNPLAELCYNLKIYKREKQKKVLQTFQKVDRTSCSWGGFVLPSTLPDLNKLLVEPWSKKNDFCNLLRSCQRAVHCQEADMNDK